VQKIVEAYEAREAADRAAEVSEQGTGDGAQSGTETP
jgi:hypothetical protein